jgi:hypothetical protein
MKTFVSGLAIAAALTTALPVWAQGVTTQGQTTQQNAPGTAGTSKPGVPGQPGSESGPAVTPSGTTTAVSRTHPSGDQSGVRGLPGNKSGPTVYPPSGAGR